MRGGDQREGQGGVLKGPRSRDQREGQGGSKGSREDLGGVLKGSRSRDQGEGQGGSKGSGEDLGQIQGRSMRSRGLWTRGVGGRTWGHLWVKECLGVLREVLGVEGT